MTDPTQTPIPEKLPLLWRLTFGLFIAAGMASLLGVVTEQSLAAAIYGALTAGVFLGAGILGLKRHPIGLYLALLILVGTAVQVDIPLLFQDDYVAAEVQRTYDKINTLAATTLSPDDELVSQIETLYRGIAIAITVAHGWMSFYLWRRRHWFAPPSSTSPANC